MIHREPSALPAADAERENPRPDTLGQHRVMFAIDDIDDRPAEVNACGPAPLPDGHPSPG